MDPTKDDIQANIELAFLGPTSTLDKYPVRRFVLSSSKPYVPLGRTSKRGNNLVAGPSNGWIDCAVMSRNHAELRLSPDTKQVFVQDTGSLHGTLLNSTKLRENEMKVLKSGDILELGVSIGRGEQEHPPCVLKASVQYHSGRQDDRSGTFKVPDESDVDEISDDEDESLRYSTRILQEDGFQPQSVARNNDVDLINVDEHFPITTGTTHATKPTYVDLTIDVHTEEHHKEADKVIPGDLPSTQDCHRTLSDVADVTDATKGGDTIIDDEESDIRLTESEGSIHESYSEGDALPEDSDLSHGGGEVTEGAVAVWVPGSPTLTEPPTTLQHEHVSLQAVEITSRATDTTPLRSKENATGTLDVDTRGVETGKSEFQLAREANRRRLQLATTLAAQELSRAHAQLQAMRVPSPAKMASPSFSLNVPAEEQPNAGDQVQAVHKTPTDELVHPLAEDFLTSPLAKINLKPPQASSTRMDLDETSAYRFELSKQAAENKNRSQKGEVMNIKNIVEPSDSTIAEPSDSGVAEPSGTAERNLSEPLSRKRKIGEISKWEAKDTEETIQDYAGTNSGTQTRAATRSVPQGQPPSKRLRRAAEVVGCVVLGGAAVMSALIATAPTL